jgi:serine/threonine-protein kinase RsbW
MADEAGAMSAERVQDTGPNVRLDLVSRSENVLLVRETLSGLAEAVQLGGAVLHDVKTAVTEACNNVVLHAYAGQGGMLSIAIYLAPDAIEVTVRDHGRGMRPELPQEARRGFGLPLIQALADRVELLSPDGAGTQVRMRFHAPGAQTLDGDATPDEAASMLAGAPLEGASLAVSPAVLARSVLARLLGALGAGAHPSTAGRAEARRLADALVAQPARSPEDDRLSIAIDVRARELCLRVGPLPAGRARALLAEQPIARVRCAVEAAQVEPVGGDVAAGEMLTLWLTDPR